MRRRELNPAFFKSRQVVSCSPFARLLFEGLWCLADREGRLVDDPWRIKLEVLPCDPVDVDALLAELVASVDAQGEGLVERYVVDGTAYIEIPRFGEHQHVHPREQASLLPPRHAKARQGGPSPAKVVASRAGSSKPSEPSGSSRPSLSQERDLRKGADGPTRLGFGEGLPASVLDGIEAAREMRA